MVAAGCPAPSRAIELNNLSHNVIRATNRSGIDLLIADTGDLDGSADQKACRSSRSGLNPRRHLPKFGGHRCGIDQYNAEGVYGCFVFTFAMPDFPHRDDPRLDLDKAGFGIMAVSETTPRRPKAAFHAVAQRYGDIHRSTQQEH